MRQMFSEFSDQIAGVLDTEFRKNRKFMSDWVRQPHVANLDVDNMGNSKNYQEAEEGKIPLYYPKKAYPTVKA